MAFGVFQFRRGTAAQWTAANTVLASGELGLETDTAKFKIGNGTTAWNSLPYGGIKGDTGATGAAGVSPTVAVGATTVVTPATNPSVTDADAGPNADLRFSLPRARNVTAGTTTTGAAGTSASVTSQADANGDVSLNFTIPRGDTGATGAQGPQGPAGQSVAVADEGTSLTAAATSINFVGGGVTATNSGSAVTVSVPANPNPATAAPGAVATAGAVGTSTDYARADHTHQGVTSLAFNGGTATSGAVSITESPAFATVAVTGQNSVVANDRNGTLTLVAGTNISLTTNDATDSVTIASTSVATNGFGIVTGNTGTASADTPADTLAITGGTGITTAATDTPDGLVITNTGVTSVAQGAGISVSAATGGVTITNTLPGYTTTTLTAPTASFSTAVTTILSQAITGGSIVAGSMFEFFVRAQVINTVTASNLVATISIGATNVVVLTQAMGTTARAAPGGAVIITGKISFSSATAAEATVQAFTSTATAFNAAAATTAAVTVVTATNTTADIKLNSSAATTTVIVREASLKRLK